MNRTCGDAVRLLSAMATGCLALAAPGASFAGPDQATRNRCTAYAQRAVRQYQLMKGHPECEANTDPTAWQGSYDYHYNGCLIFPASMSQFADSARDNHLQACGALSGGAVPATGPADSGTAEANTAPVAIAGTAAQITPPQTASVSPPLVMHFCAQHCKTLVWDNGHYVHHSADATEIWTVESFTPRSVILRRTDSNGFSGVYAGQMSVEGNHIVEGTFNGHPDGYKLTWGTALDSIAGK